MSAPDSMRLRMEQMVRQTQESICQALEELDGKHFDRDLWTRPDGGGGDSRVMQNGHVFEKAGVNVAVVGGAISSEAAQSALGRDRILPEGPVRFFATGLSVVMHPHNPMAPSAHANYRYFELSGGATPVRWWFGGGADLSPSYLIREDAIHFHRVHKHVCDDCDPAFYPRFKQWCDDYFYIVHRGERRGVGGICFDNLNDRDQNALFTFVSSCARAFIPAYLPIVKARKDTPFGDIQKHWQRIRRGRYAEFNLLYDRGTTFGLRTGGRTESILMSLPLVASWEETPWTQPDSEEGRVLEVLKNPQQWVEEHRQQ
jgi:coproporphyrinogen III oxidase